VIVSGYDGCCIAHPSLGNIAMMAILYVSLIKLDLKNGGAEGDAGLCISADTASGA
jgi:hypothetical protein